jgi:MFS family permease
VVTLNLGFLTKDFKVSRRKIVASTLLLGGALAWFFLINAYIFDIFTSITPNEPLSNNYYNIGQALFYAFIIISAVIGSFIGKTISRSKLLLAWILLGTFSTIFLTFSQGPIFLLISGTLLGISFGWGLPISMAFLADCTVIEERARVSGITILTTFIIVFLTIAVKNIFALEMTVALGLFALVRLSSVVALTLSACDLRTHTQIKPLEIKSGAYREFALYLFPWLMFCVAGGLATNLIPETSPFDSAVSLGNSLKYIFIAVFGLVSGIIADRIGRRWPIRIGLVVLGISFALLGVSMSWGSVVFYLATSGIAWGLFFTIFLAIPGDLSTPDSREKYYAIMYILPIGSLFALSTIPGWAIFSNANSSSLSQIFSIIIFLAIIPTLQAKETLPEEKIQNRKLKEHLENVEKIIKENKE